MLPTNCCIIGPGAIGLMFAALLAPKFKVHVVCRDDTAALNLSDITLSGDVSARATPNQVRFTQNIDAVPNDCWYLICTKAYDAATAVAQVARRLTSTTPLALTCNGLGIFQDIAHLVPRDCPVLRVLSETGAEKLSVNAVRISGQLKVIVAEPAGRPSAFADFERLISGLGGSCQAAPNIAHAEWEKAILNIAVNPICLLHEIKNGVILERQELKELSITLIEEARAVAQAEGFSMPTSGDFLARIKNSADNWCSSVRDYQAGRRTELEYILGRAIRIAKAHFVSVPRLEAIWRKCQEKEAARTT